MLELERLEHILEYLRENQTATVNNLSRRLFVSEATVRRDLTELERRGLVKRIHGGAVLLDSTTGELPLYVRQQQNGDAKQLIAAQALQYIQDGQVIFLDASSTVMYLIPFFENFENLTIITNGVKTAHELQRLHHKTYCTGGLMLHHSAAYVGDFAMDFIRQFNADVVFFSSRGVSDSGMITDASQEETAVRRAMFAQSRKKVFLCDSSKFGKSYCYNLCPVSQVDIFLSDKPVPEAR